MVNAYFLDSSALVKRYIPETGSGWIQNLADTSAGNLLIIARITWVEVLSALARRHREGSLITTDLNLVIQQFRFDLTTQYRVVELNQLLSEQAGQLVTQYPLRAYDAIQLASGLRTQSAFTSATATTLIFVTADVQLLTIAQSAGLTTDNPNNYP
ncbi:MAG: type II toxin-antitoxin system VapC family toxin [Leptolyngbyaceae cyanobacterium bins.302]|nr:type II toxin-antitoxin system VapC family toxin [Leptolyngbyaceae cyanobacterium bins.302]